jgi:bacterioferritin
MKIGALRVKWQVAAREGVDKGLMDTTKDKDMVTYNLALTILEQEVEHEEDLQGLREDLNLMVQRGSK